MKKKTKSPNWEKVKTEYITTEISYRQLSKKYGIPINTLGERGKKEGWVQARKEYKDSVVSAAVQKIGAEQADFFAEELNILEYLREALRRAVIEDTEQFYKYIVNETEYDFESKTSTTTATEKVLSKLDTKALKEAVEALERVEKMRRSMEGILTIPQKEQLELGREKLALERKRLEQHEDNDNEVVVTIKGYEEDWSM